VNRNECSGGVEWIGDFTPLCMQVGYGVVQWAHPGYEEWGRWLLDG
jgi:hypothetical protein